ncbi:MAG: dihydrolipoyl dehydrogenase [Chitinivibrionales bacterium]|nr:dihydrolipoyl dehydrogenase [Chitinivibrionales bacterium]
MNEKYDLIVIGAGPGGYVGAIRAAQRGLKAAVIEKDKPGGVCLNIGCIPSKSLIHESNNFRLIPSLKELGVKIDAEEFDYRKVFERSRKAADTLSKGVDYLLKKNGIELIKGIATLKDSSTVLIDGDRELTARNILLATGSHPRQIPGFEFDHKQILSSDDALMLTKLPKSICILGGGAIGVEFAHIFNAFGVDVHIVEMLGHLVPLEDDDIAAELQKSFSKRGIHIHTLSKATTLKKTKTRCKITIENVEKNQETLSVDQVLVVVGRVPNTGKLGLENSGIQTDKGFIPVGDYYQTCSTGVFAVGDVVASPMLAHVASKEAQIAVEFMAGDNPQKWLDSNHIPSAVYCEPQIASFGLTEKQAKESGIPFKKATFPYRGVGKSVAVGSPEGMVKIIFDDKYKEILGCHLVGADATEIIHELLLAKKSELLPEDIASMVHAHPTLSEAVMESMRAVEGWAVHV